MIQTDLFNFSYMTHWFLQLDALAEMALPEPWCFRNPQRVYKNTDTPILDRYIQGIFRILSIEYNAEPDPQVNQKYLHIENEFACFHTGLYTKQYKAIYACFNRNKRNETLLQWCFRGFADEQSPQLRYISPLPEAPAAIMPQIGQYYPEWPVRVNTDHILGDPANIERLPQEFLSFCCPTVLLEAVVDLARRKAGAVPDLVVPQFYRQKVQFLLPLYISNLDKPDLAITLTPMNDFYLGHTCLTLEMAYQNARLMKRPTAAWLTALVEGDKAG